MSYELLGREIELETALLAESREYVRDQLSEYERGDRREFDLTVDFPDGFTGEVHRELCAIPYGETRTYGELADRLSTAPIAIGQACARNPLPVVVPCHRVVGADSLRGYIYPGFQEKLLELERGHGGRER
ncbi:MULTISPECIES: methylated-DNA--[protein]-cysteine S-methyltransferase [Halorussus]|uniref:methylated-DNA--[protein]-cysteine S-methyltransferase n=1 Tax=Halorussus TaxID=1070314 RepID=UPI00209ED2AE|nr:methylated-DNA--[protein]-cysteine S-methyltransferase [Halorussus vallis]USZ74127.1 methylated-DNA--[protein]-cysteine S-methyltransferase [Halorussus vallis]